MVVQILAPVFRFCNGRFQDPGSLDLIHKDLSIEISPTMTMTMTVKERRALASCLATVLSAVLTQRYATSIHLLLNRTHTNEKTRITAATRADGATESGF